MFGCIRYAPRFSAEEASVDGLRLLVIALPPEAGLRRRMGEGRAARQLLRRGVRECVCPEGFAFPADWRRRGLCPVDPRPLLAQKAAQWTLLRRQAEGLSGSIALTAPRVTAEVTQTLRRLLKRTDQLALLAAPGAEELQWRLRRETGASLRLLTETQLPQAETLLHFGSSSARGRRLTLSLTRPEEPLCFVLPPRLAAELPDGAEGGSLAPLLWRSGLLRAEEIGLKIGN